MKSKTNDKYAYLLGMPVIRYAEDGVLEEIVTLVKSADRSQCKMLITLNVDFIVNAIPCRPFRYYPGLWQILRRAALITADGMPLVLLSKLLGVGIAGRTTGADMVPRLAERAASEGLSLYFLGGTPESAMGAADILTKRHPGLKIVGIDTPFVSIEDTAESREQDRVICAKINAANPDLLLIGFGNPKQEIWLARNAAQLHIPAAIGIGGTFNFICGTVRRAPVWVQKSGCEWIYRIIQEPKRLWKRYGIGLMKFNLLCAKIMLSRLCSWMLSWRKNGTLKIDWSPQGVTIDFRDVIYWQYEMTEVLAAAENAACNKGDQVSYCNIRPLVAKQLHWESVSPRWNQ